ncbi:HipA family kinase [Azorhizophilus paspali]|uniref:HipA family kinase n=1 Tax=Azorhizophilus paspali TaxID=69963 RepID=A0ABV6SRP4_AZOPA
MAMDHFIEAVEIIRRLEGGITRPFLCRASNGKHYVAKGLELPPAERIAELLCARLAARFGLPIPEHGYIYIDPALLRYDTEARRDLGPGDSFALAYVADAADLLYSQALQVPADLQKSVFVFDYWIGNGDRQLGQWGGRPNLLMCSTDNLLRLIDHNQAFCWPLDTGAFADTHVFGPGNRSWRLDLLDKVEYGQRMHDTACRFRDLCSDIPDEWRESVGVAEFDILLKEIESHLMRCQSDDFWSALE